MRNIKKPATVSLILILLLSFSCKKIVYINNDPPVNTGFMRTFGTDFYDYGWGVDETFDDGFIIAGAKQSRADLTKDAVLIKTDERGFGVWEKNYGGTGDEEFYSVKQCLNGGFIAVGYTSSQGDFKQVYIVKTDSYGDIEWEKIDGGPNLDIGNEIIETRSGNFIIVGFTNSPGYSHGNHDVWLQKIDDKGNTIWRRSYGEINHEVGYDVMELDNGSLLVLGYKDFYGDAGKDTYLFKTDSTGGVLWEKTFGSSGEYDEIGYSIQEVYPSGYMICASTNSRGNGWHDPQVIKIDLDGNMDWSGIYNGSSHGYTRWVSTPTYDGGAVIVGTTTHFNGNNEDIYMIKIDENGQQLWNKSYEGKSSDWGWAVKETRLNNLILVGSTKSFGHGLYDIFLMKTDEFGHYDFDN